ncbi:MAG: ABC transporter transmembrane domain-containing protein, partial [Defluviitaleaceae bacterium]|nr:ABC transporter transmembrane domain-containing protein [Defluviitaleaceae bacterium]
MNEHFYYDGELQVCKALCDYFKVDIKVPTKDFADSFSNLSEEVLYLSGIRYKNVQLYGKWWKHANGAMLGHLDTGTPIALLPDRISGYRAYDPIQDKTYRVDDTEAAKIKTQVTAVFRAFPTEKVHLKHIVNFIVGENIYKEIAIIILCSFLAGIIQMIPPFVAAHIFDVIIPENLRTMMFEVIFMLLAFALANVGFSVMINMSVTRIKIKSSLAVQAALWDRLISLRVPFFSKYTTGELLHKIRNIEQVKDMVSLESLQSIFANLFAFVYIIALYNFSTSITNYVLSMFLILFLAYGIAIKRKFKLHKHYTDLENRSMSFNHQCVRGMYRIKVSGAEERVFKKWTDYEEEKRSVTNRIRSINNFLNSFHLFFDFASAAIVYLLIARAGYVDVGMFIAYVSIFLILQRSVRRLLRTLNILPRLMAACANV